MISDTTRAAGDNVLVTFARQARQALENPLAAWLVLLVALLLTGVGWQLAERTVQTTANQRFAYQTDDIVQAISQRLKAYETALRGGAALFGAMGDVSREEWRRYVNDLQVDKSFPGIQGLGYALVMPAAEVGRHVAEMRAQGFSDYVVRPEGVREPSSAIIYLEPFDWRNQRAFGFDMFSEPVRNQAMRLAIDSGQPTVSGRVTLVQETEKDTQQGFLMYAPVYRRGVAVPTVEERRAAIRGFVYAPFRARDLMVGVLGNLSTGLEFELYADASPGKGSLLYASDGHPEHLHALDSSMSPLFKSEIRLQVADKLWALNVQAPQGYLTTEEVLLPLMVAITGLAVAFLLFWIVGAIARQKQRAELAAQNLARKLGESESRYLALFGSAHTPMLVIDPEDGTIVEANLAAAAFYGYSQSVLASMNIGQINTLPRRELLEEMADARERKRNRFYFSHRLASGEVRPVEVYSGVFSHEGRELLYSIIQDMSERKRIEAELIDSEQHYRYVMEATGEGVWDWDIANNLVHHNITWCEILGLNRDLLVHPVEFFVSALYAEDAGAVGAAIQRTLETGEPYVSEHRMCRADGSLVWVLDRGKVVERDADGKAIRMVGCIADISARRLIEKELAAEREKWQTLLNEASDGIHVLNTDGSLAVFSQSFARMLGYLPEEMQHLRVSHWDAGIPEDQLVGVIDELLKTPRVFETRHRRKDGSVFDVEISASSIVVAGKQYLYASARDISERKQQALEIDTQRTRLQNILEGTRAGTWEWNIPSGEVVVNERWAEIVGYTLQELAPVSIDTWMKLAHPEDLQESEVRLKAHFSGELPYYEFETRMRHKDGHWVWVLDRGRVFAWSEAGEPLMMAGTHQDITRQKEVEQGLHEARRNADAANLAKSQFLATMSHEIRTPMNGILGMAQLLMMPDTHADERENYVRTIYHSGQSLLALLNDILDLAKVEAGKIELESLVFSPVQLGDEVVALFSDVTRQKHLTVSSTCEGIGANEQYWGDPVRIRQVLSNLVSNAIKFTEQGAVRLRLEKRSQDDHGAVLRFSVEDTGIGISEAQRAQLFKPFSQVDGTITRRFGGTGLGLAIARNLVELMRGEMGVESTPGKGSTFWFDMPLSRVPGNEEGRHDEAKLVVPTASRTGNGKCILLVEDVHTNRVIIETYLGKRGFRIVALENGEQAVEWIRQQDAPDLVLMDCQMPVMDGLEATRQIRAWEAEKQKTENARRIPIVALTADVFEDNRRSCVAAGMDDFLAKPFSFVEVERVLARWILSDEALPVSAAESPTEGHDSGVSVPVADDPALSDTERQNLLPPLIALDELLSKRMMKSRKAASEIFAGLKSPDLAKAFVPVVDGIERMQYESARQSLQEFLSLVMPHGDAATVEVAPGAGNGPEAAGTDAAILAVGEALERMGGDFDLLLIAATLLPEQISNDRKAIAQAVDASDSRALRKAAHRLKGGLGTIGANRAGAVCKRLETLATHDEVAMYAETHRELVHELDNLEVALLEFLASSRTPNE